MNQLQTAGETALARLQDTGRQIDKIIDECLPVLTGDVKSFTQSLAIAKGVHDLKTIMLNSPEIKSVVMSMANNRLGFLTDRTPAILWRNQQNGKKPQNPYKYEQLVDPIVEGMLKGYRITNNEMNIIAGAFYAAKNGNHRKVIEYPGVTDFAYNNAPVELLEGGRVARVKCWAVWRLNGTRMSIGVDKDDELILQIRVNNGMGEDGVIGKAHSKLFKRILERVSGRVAPEASDVDDVVGDAEVIPTEDDFLTGEEEDEAIKKSLKDKDISAYKDASKPTPDVQKKQEETPAKEKKELGSGMDEGQLWELFHSQMNACGIRDEKSMDKAEQYVVHNSKTSGMSIEDTLRNAINNRISFVQAMAKWNTENEVPEDESRSSKYSGANSRPPEGTRLDGLPVYDENHPLFKEKWWGMRSGDYKKGTGLAYYLNLHAKTLDSVPEEIQRELVDKHSRVYPGQAFPYQLKWFEAGEDGVNDDAQEMTDAELRTELRAARTDLVQWKQQEPDLFKDGLKNLLQEGSIINKIPAQMSLDECNVLIDEIKSLKDLQSF